MPPAPTAIPLPGEAATVCLAEDVAAAAAPGDTIALSGDLGAGKTTFARAFLRAFFDAPALEVPSPTFTLVQTYRNGRFPVSHFDFYRLADAGELDEIGFDEALEEGAVLIEWPERAAGRLPEARLEIALAFRGTAREAWLSPHGDWAARLERSLAVRAFVDAGGRAGASRRHIQGDASGRRFERIAAAGATAVLMDWRPQGPAPAGSYDARAGRARDVGAFLAVAGALRDAGASPPEVLAVDRGHGLLLMEDFGTDGIARDGEPVVERYETAIDLLARLHGEKRPRALPVAGGGRHVLPAYDRDVLAVELSLFADHEARLAPDGPDRHAFAEAWEPLFDRLDAAETGWVLRDVHSPNLFWLPRREGIRRIGLIDLQDALWGPVAYDVASLVDDARVTVPAALREHLLARYAARRAAAAPDFDRRAFEADVAILGAQRAMKILGIFARLAREEGRTGYLAHVPRLREYLRVNLGHPVLSRVALWYDAFVTQARPSE